MVYVLIFMGITYLLWIHYVAIMRLMQVRDAGLLTVWMKVVGYPALVVGLFLDLIVNVFFVSLLLLELPKEFTVSARLTRHSEYGGGWRKKVCTVIRVGLLDNIDPNGIHRG